MLNDSRSAFDSGWSGQRPLEGSSSPEEPCMMRLVYECPSEPLLESEADPSSSGSDFALNYAPDLKQPNVKKQSFSEGRPGLKENIIWKHEKSLVPQIKLPLRLIISIMSIRRVATTHSATIWRKISIRTGESFSTFVRTKVFLLQPIRFVLLLMRWFTSIWGGCIQ